MIRKRIFYLIVILAALLLVMYTDSFLAAFFLAVTVALPVVSLLVSLPAMKGCRVRVDADTAAAGRGSEAHWRVTVENRRRLPLSRITLRFQLSNAMTGKTETTTLRLSGASEGNSFFLPADTDHCGMLGCTLIRCRVLDGMGLFSLRHRLTATAMLPVMPLEEQDAELPEFPKERREETATHARRGGGSGEDYDLRPYRPGDPVRLIHWKLSSKRDELIFREVLEAEATVPLLTFDHVGPAEALDRVLDRLYTMSQLLLEQERSHIIAWLHPVTGALREYPVGGTGEQRRCFQAILSDPAPSSGHCLSEDPKAVRPGSGRTRIHLAQEQEETP